MVRVAADGVMMAGANARPRRWSRSPPIVTPMSHGACKPVRDVVLGKKIDSRRRHRGASPPPSRLECMDLLQAAHTFSGIEMALWDVLGQEAQCAGL